MDYYKYVFLDYKDIQDINFNIINKKVKIIVIIGKNEITIPVDLLNMAQSFGNSLEWINIENDENKDVLYSFIINKLGYYTFKQGNKEFIIYSKNKDFDPVIEYYQDKKINLKRIENIKQINEIKKENLIKKLFKYISFLWSKFTLIQKIFFIGIIITVITSLVSLHALASTSVFYSQSKDKTILERIILRIDTALNTITQLHTPVPVFSTPINDKEALDRIVQRINQEGVKVSVTSNGIIKVANETTARRIRAILVLEDFVPKGTYPWAVFNKERWTATDFTNNVNFRRAQTQMITDHIKALSDVDNANVTIVVPDRTLFAADQNPITASVVITPRPGSDIITNRKKIKGIQRLLKLAIEGLKDENIVIIDHMNNVLNDFTDMAPLDRLYLFEREQKQIQQLEAKYRTDILKQLQSIYGADRISNLNVKIDMDKTKKVISTEEFIPFVLRPRTPGSAYDDSEIFKSVTLSLSTWETKWKVTGFNPEGPPGRKDQIPPSLKDLSNIYGKMIQQTKVEIEAINKMMSQEERSPEFGRVTVAVNIDGKWEWKYNENGKPVVTADGSIERIYTPVSEKELFDAVMLVMEAIGYNPAINFTVTVANIPIDREKEFAQEDAVYFKPQKIGKIIFFLFGLIIISIIISIIFSIWMIDNVNTHV